MRVLVTGARGMIGSLLVRELIDAGNVVVGVDAAGDECIRDNYRLYNDDLSDRQRLTTIMDEGEIDRVIHLAALAHTTGENDLSWDRYRHVNVECSKNVFDSAGDRPVLFVSTVDVYGFYDGTRPVDGRSPIAPVSRYAKSKALAEQECMRLAHYTIFRLSPVYTDTVRRDIQKRYYLKYPWLAYQVGEGTSFEVLSATNAVDAMVCWCSEEPCNDIRIIKDEKPMWTPSYIEAERAEGRAKVVLHLPRPLVSGGYALLKRAIGENEKTYLLSKAVHPLRTERLTGLTEAARGKRVLIPEGYCKQCLPFIRGFKDLGCEVTVLCGSKLDCGYASRLPDHKIVGTCDLRRPDESERYLVELVKSGRFDLVYPIFDFSARVLSHHKEELSKYAVIYANDREIFDRANDKNEVMRVCAENGIPCPQTVFGASTVDDVEESGIRFPVIIKPRRMYGARGFHRFESVAEMRGYVAEREIDLGEYVVQECIPDDSRLIGANIFIDRAGEVKSSYLYICEHVYPEVGGTSTLNAILERDDIREYCERLVRVMGLRGEVGVDLMLDSRDDVGKVIEINVRPVHGVSMGFFFGVDNARQVIEDAYDLPVTRMEIARTDTAVRILQTDVLWFLSSPDRFRRSPRRLGYRHVKEQMFFWDDPKPWFAFLFDGVKNYRKKMLEKTQ